MDFSTFRTNLKNLIYARGLTVKDFAAEINTSVPTIHRYLTGDRTPDLPYVVKIATYFNVSIDWLLGIRQEQFDLMSKEVRDVSIMYSIASPDDRRVVQAVLGKYKERV